MAGGQSYSPSDLFFCPIFFRTWSEMALDSSNSLHGASFSPLRSSTSHIAPHGPNNPPSSNMWKDLLSQNDKSHLSHYPTYQLTHRKSPSLKKISLLAKRNGNSLLLAMRLGSAPIMGLCWQLSRRNDTSKVLLNFLHLKEIFSS